MSASTLYLSKHTSYDYVILLHKFKILTLSRYFFHFFKILLLWFVRERERIKKAKNGQKWQKILPHFVSQELHLMWLWFLVLMCKMMISPANFFIFLTLFPPRMGGVKLPPAPPLHPNSLNYLKNNLIY